MKATSTVLIASMAVLAFIVLKQNGSLQTAWQEDEERSKTTGQGLLTRAEAISVTLDWISASGEDFQIQVMEPRLMTYGEFARLDSGNALGTPAPMTLDEIESEANPVWAVVFSADINLARTSLFGGSDEAADYYMGAGGEDHVWPDGSSRGSIVIDASTGDILATNAHSRVSTNDYFFDRVLAYPTPVSP